MGSDGFLCVDDLLAHPRFRSYSLDDVQRVVATNDKQRFKLRPHPEDGRLQIRANQGHSVQVEGAFFEGLDSLALTPLDPLSPDTPPSAVHGSYLRHWSSIRTRGLSRMSRTHIHLAPGLPGDKSVISGMRGDCDLTGLQFFRSDNGVILTPRRLAGAPAPPILQQSPETERAR
ncbi:tRNA 2'-phosphotransferase 1-like [Acipenser ruthenus]|uniref:tRNA 2'-phosphotransferase 1-like n=1 Tax=Acipenser ruthenus TaxID=7906 RepID=UPI00274279AE|nr:tRNA 2'-phosphotransferase 1-like [Acipenser ruthenus]